MAPAPPVLTALTLVASLIAGGACQGGSPVVARPRVALITAAAGDQGLATALRDRANATVTVHVATDTRAAEQAAREAVARGAGAVALAGGDLAPVAEQLAPQYPKVAFLEETPARRPGLPFNVWQVAVELYQGYYLLGVLAGRLSRSHRVAFVAGARNAETLAELNAVRSGSERGDKAAASVWSFTGSPLPGPATAAGLEQIALGADVLLATGHGAAAGAVQAAEGTPGVRVLLAQGEAGNPPAVAAVLKLDLAPAYVDAVRGVGRGRLGGYAEVRPGHGLELAPGPGLPPAAVAAAEAVAADVAAGGTTVPHITDRIYPAPAT